MTTTVKRICNPAITPGPIQAVGTFLYQLDVTPGNLGGNLWGGGLNAHNGNDKEYVEKAVKLFLAAEDMLKALQEGHQKLATYVSVYPGDKQLRKLLKDWDAAIAKATQL